MQAAIVYQRDEKPQYTENFPEPIIQTKTNYYFCESSSDKTFREVKGKRQTFSQINCRH